MLSRDDELIEAFTEEMENKPGFEDFRKAGQGLSPSMLKKWRLAGALYFTKAAFDQREWIAGLWWMSGPFEGKLPADGGFVLGAIAASFDLEAKQRDPDLELFCMTFDYKMSGTGGGKGCDCLKGIGQQLQLGIGSMKSKVCSTLRYTYARGLTQKIRTELEAAEPGSGEHALWQRMNGAVADVAVTQNAGNKRSLTEMQKSAGVNGARNLGILIRNRIGEPGLPTNLPSFLAWGGNPFDEPIFVDASLSALDQHIFSNPSRLFDVRGHFMDGAQDIEYPVRLHVEDPVVNAYISTGCLIGLGLGAFKWVLGHHGPGTMSLRFGQHNRSTQYLTFEQQALRQPATSGTQWIFDREHEDFRLGRNLVHPDLYTELSALAVAHQVAGVGAVAARVVPTADLMHQFV